MAKKKAPAPWSINTNTAKKAAKSSIQEIKTTKEPTKKEKRGRPAVEKEKAVRLVVTNKARNMLKKIAAIRETTMMEAMEDILEKEWEQMKKRY